MSSSDCTERTYSFIIWRSYILTSILKGFGKWGSCQAEFLWAVGTALLQVWQGPWLPRVCEHRSLRSDVRLTPPRAIVRGISMSVFFPKNISCMSKIFCFSWFTQSGKKHFGKSSLLSPYRHQQSQQTRVGEWGVTMCFYLDLIYW